MKKNNRPGLKRERIVTVLASVLVLTALTATGLYVKKQNTAKYDGYMLDLREMEDGAGDTIDRISGNGAGETNGNSQTAQKDDLDSDPFFRETTGSAVDKKDDKGAATTVTGSPTPTHATATPAPSKAPRSKPVKTPDEPTTPAETSPQAVPDETSSAEVTDAFSGSLSAPKFDSESTLQWPIVGNVLISYSMDKTVYFPTLKQYKYNPAIIISATVGEGIAAAADGKIASVSRTPELGNIIVMDIGSGYQVTYGQLENITVNEGDAVAKGQVVGSIAAPTIYYSAEGGNLYFKLTKDGVPMDPLSKLQ